MLPRPTPTTTEKSMREGDFIVSKTDLQGRITYANRIFMEFAGYTEQELIGAPHNLIRHPDMPRGVFELLWDSVRQGKEIWAYVKNLSKDGSFYWVLANVTPTYADNGDFAGYYSVRRKPDPRALQAIQELYAALLKAEEGKSPKDACTASLGLMNQVLSEKGVSYDEFILTL